MSAHVSYIWDPSASHHYIKGNISVFSRGFVCFCYFNPNVLHGDLHLYCAEYWGDSRMSALKKWGVKTQLLFFALFGGWKINYVVTKAVFKQPLNVSVLLNPL